MRPHNQLREVSDFEQVRHCIDDVPDDYVLFENHSGNRCSNFDTRPVARLYCRLTLFGEVFGFCVDVLNVFVRNAPGTQGAFETGNLSMTRLHIFLGVTVIPPRSCTFLKELLQAVTKLFFRVRFDHGIH